MAQSDLNVSNLALRLMGNRSVLTALSDVSEAGLACFAMVDDCKKALLRMHPWNFAIKRKVLTPPAAVTLTTPFVEYVSASTIKFTVASHTFVAGNYITAADTGVPEAVGVFEVTLVTATTVTCATPTVVTSITGTPAAGTIRLSPAFDFSYIFALPSDFLRVLKVNDSLSNADWRVEGQSLVSDDALINLKYVYNVTDYATMDVLFYQILAHYLAYNLCDDLSASDAKKQELYAYLWGGNGRRGMLPLGKFVDASEDGPEEASANDWVNSRLVGPTSGVVTSVDVA